MLSYSRDFGFYVDRYGETQGSWLSLSYVTQPKEGF